MRKIDEIIIHCSATREDDDIDAATIREWHLQKGWRDIGYHYIVRLDGEVELGRPLDEIGAHVKSRNKTTVGICYIGGVDEDLKPKDTMTNQQETSVRDLIMALRFVFNANLKISGHNEYANKACPSFNVQEKFSDILS